MLRTLALAVLACLPPALALGQEAEEGPKTGAELAPLLIGRLEADCAAFTADARAMSRDAGAAGEAMALATPDGAMVMLNSGEELGDYVLTRFFTETRLSTVRTVACGYSAYRPFGGMGDGGIDTGEDYYRLLSDRAAALLGGTPEEVGGPVFSRGETGRLAYWATGSEGQGMPPRASLMLMVAATSVSVSLLHTYSAGAEQ